MIIMEQQMKKIQTDIQGLMDQWSKGDFLEQGDLFVVGCSTSEVIGKQIGTFGSDDVAKILYEALITFARQKNIYLAFQCCEHINRALVVEKVAAKAYDLEVVSVIPHQNAGGSMATYAYKHMDDPVVVETIQAHAGMDIGDTLIGMHIKAVAVPLRFEQNEIGSAHVTLAKRRPKLIGGERAIYS